MLGSASPRLKGSLGFLLFLSALAGCATVSVPARLRSQDDLRAAEGATSLYVLPDSAVAVEPAWGHLEADSMVLYRRTDASGPPTYRRKVRDVGSSGVEITGYTLADGQQVRLNGSVRRIGDQLEFERRWRSMEKVDTSRVVLPVSEVRSIEVPVPSTGRTALLWGVILLATAAGFALGMASSLDESAM